MNKKNILLIITIIVLSIVIVSIILILNNKNQSKKNEETSKTYEEEKVLELIDGKIKAQLFLNSEISENDTEFQNIKKELEGKDYIDKIEFVSKEQALEKMKEKFADSRYIFDGYEGDNNIFPNSFIVTIKINSLKEFNESYVENIFDKLSQIEYIHEIQYGGLDYIKEYNQHGIEGLKEYIAKEEQIEEQLQNLR